MKNTAIEDEVNEADPEGSFPMLGENLERIEAGITMACREAGRSRTEISLMAVSKMHPAAAVLAAQVLGIRIFGENRVQEFQEKSVALGAAGTTGAEFHLIGHLQSNKAARAAELFSSIDTLDSLALAERLNQAATRLGRRLAVLIEIKLSHEPSKAGVLPDSDELRLLLEHLPGLTALEVRGLMTVPPYLKDLAAVQPYFARLRTLRDQLAAEHPRLSFAELSMGMSHDFPAAIAEGATQVRIGTALFGARKYPK